MSTENPFAANLPSASKQGGAMAQSDQQRAVAEVQAAMMIARMNPRDQIAAMDRILNACTRPTLANAAVYTYSKGGSDISGPSIRLAEAMAQAWGNMQFGIREIDQSNGESTVQAYAWDVETNTRREITFQVPHLRYTRKGSYKIEDPREIYELVANQGSRRLRACILATIPGDVTEAAVAQCETTMNASADTTPEGIKKLVEAFEKFGVSRQMIEKRIQRRIDAIQPAQVVSLRKIWASVNDGMSQPAEWFETEESATAPAAPPAASKTDSVRDRVRRTREPDPAAKPDTQTGKTDAPAYTYAQVADALHKAADADALGIAADMIRFVADELQQAELNGLYQNLAAKIDGE